MIERLPDDCFLMENTFVLIDAGFLSKLSRYYGKGRYLRYDLIKLAKLIAQKQNLVCKKIFYYTAPPFQSPKPTKEENKRKEDYDSFIKKIKLSPEILVREGRCQRLKLNGKYKYKQKGVDILLAMDLMEIKLKYPEVRKVILIASDSDFVPIVNSLKEKNIKTFLCTYYINKRNTNFSRSNYLLDVVTQYFKLTKEDFDKCPLNKKTENKIFSSKISRRKI